MSWALALLGGYLLGSIPFGIVITRALGLGDLRQIGSGNIGATNVLRTGNKRAALATLVLDSGKGAAAVLIALWLAGSGAAAVAGLGAFAGHLYPVWLRFRGGKGVATYLGILLAMAPLAGIGACLTWLATAAIGRISSLSALVAAALAPLYVWFAGSPLVETLATAVMAVLIFWRHRDNIGRLRAGTEPRIGRGRQT
ncbi:glycerol-3-phosphate 1-O-acyltransferase PlsY [Halovulum dunhuangense]|uniref:Glycerol-3-phosphate acyltransferase n=1 Tax=Halovulum dunhuangense TaxID=1505036 RepID=A0A849KW30_9RHOB|nr:glycerol-3-phosphate 1-O-acyltransferase PlsY [Halovulum dunhuangense]NNU79678.1 glycerol-3-phosphate 1-O-acyltransferase PlsY [Halovulum dunhuangense]